MKTYIDWFGFSPKRTKEKRRINNNIINFTCCNKARHFKSQFRHTRKL